MSVLKFQRKPRALMCEGCGASYIDRQIIPTDLCATCEKQQEADDWARWDARARSRGYASAEEEYAAWCKEVWRI